MRIIILRLRDTQAQGRARQRRLGEIRSNPGVRHTEKGPKMDEWNLLKLKSVVRRFLAKYQQYPC